MVAALEHTRPRTGIKSQQVFIRTAIDQLCTKLETTYNNGEPFPSSRRRDGDDRVPRIPPHEVSRGSRVRGSSAALPPSWGPETKRRSRAERRP
ncbi:hypothetical protein KTN60_30490 [Rhodococcus qingshengii]|nr:hypothetical protein [Rhodococcus qingshengii]